MWKRGWWNNHNRCTHAQDISTWDLNAGEREMFLRHKISQFYQEWEAIFKLILRACAKLKKYASKRYCKKKWRSVAAPTQCHHSAVMLHGKWSFFRNVLCIGHLLPLRTVKKSWKIKSITSALWKRQNIFLKLGLSSIIALNHITKWFSEAAENWWLAARVNFFLLISTLLIILITKFCVFLRIPVKWTQFTYGHSQDGEKKLQTVSMAEFMIKRSIANFVSAIPV